MFLGLVNLFCTLFECCLGGRLSVCENEPLCGKNLSFLIVSALTTIVSTLFITVIMSFLINLIYTGSSIALFVIGL